MTLQSYFLYIFTCFIFTGLVLKLLIPVAKFVNLVDEPDYRKLHVTPTPLVGGVGVFFTFILVAFFLPDFSTTYKPLLCGISILLLAGLLDDMHELSAKKRFIMQIVVACLLFFWGHEQLLNIGKFFSDKHIQLGFTASLLITIVSLTGLMNATNMLDGVDGLLGTVSVIQFSFLAYLNYQANLFNNSGLLCVVISGLLAFLYFNFPFSSSRKSLLFLGDAGSMPIGLLLFYFAVPLSNVQHGFVSPIIILWILVVPLFDIAATILRRIVQGNSPFKPDREHIHHLLLALGFSHRSITLTLASVTLLSGLFALFCSKIKIHPGYLLFGFIFLFTVYFIITQKLWLNIGTQYKLDSDSIAAK